MVEALLAVFPNVEFFEMYDVFIEASHDLSIYNTFPQTVKRCFPLLTGLSLRGCNEELNNNLIKILSPKLVSIAHSFKARVRRNLHEIPFPKLKNVLLRGADERTISGILSNAQNIEKFAIYPEAYGTVSLTQEDYEIIIPKIFASNELKYAFFSTDRDNFKPLLDKILKEIFKIERATNDKRQQGRSLKLRLNVNLRLRLVTSESQILREFMFECAIQVGTIVHWLSTSALEHFMLILDFEEANNMRIGEGFWSDDNIKYVDMMKSMQRISPAACSVSAYGWCFVIQNKKCNINGWSEASMIPTKII